jgi:hypothetical protein
MTNLTETATYEAGVYQLETTDPVQGGAGGVDNVQAQQLANRTAWLKAQVDALNTAGGTWAPINSPGFTGQPTAPTAPAGNNSTRLSTTAFVAAAITAASWAPINSPGFTGTPTAPTPETSTNNTQLSTTAFVRAAISQYAQGKVTISSAAPSGGTNGDIWFVI